MKYEICDDMAGIGTVSVDCRVAYQIQMTHFLEIMQNRVVYRLYH